MVCECVRVWKLNFSNIHTIFITNIDLNICLCQIFDTKIFTDICRCNFFLILVYLYSSLTLDFHCYPCYMFSLFVLAALLDLSKDQIMLCEDISTNVTMLVQQILIEKIIFFSSSSISLFCKQLQNFWEPFRRYMGKNDINITAHTIFT